MEDKNLMISSAISTINTEIKGLQALLEIFDEKYCQAINLILQTQGKVILSGIGKSGHIANKISSTLASTGTPSFFVHPSEASHGDLGMIGKNDLVIILSNSGQTREISDLIRYCKNNNISIIGIVRKSKSQLAIASNIALIIPEIEEANSVNAPTTSTTMMIALGDAIAVSLIKARKFNSQNFSILHPGGKLGSALTKIKDLMRCNNDIPIAKTNDNIEKVLLEITSKRLGCCGVVNQDNQLIGIITDGDLRRHLVDNFLKKTAEEIMSINPQIIDQELFIGEAIEVMNSKKITILFICDNQKKPIGIIHLHDCLKEINN
jgi:arabinose-5-phosphate isomerase